MTFKIVYLWIIGITVLGLWTLGPSVAAAQSFILEFDESSSYEGHGVFGEPGFDFTDDVVSEIPIRARLSGEITGRDVTIGPDGFQVETSRVWLEFGHSFFEVDWHALHPVEGSYDEGTGQMDLTVDLIQIVSFAGSSCSVGPIPMTLSTENYSAVGSGARFDDGVNGSGALVGDWEAAPVPGGDECNMLALQCRPRHTLLRGPGAFGLARGFYFDHGPLTADWARDKFGLVAPISDGGCADPPQIDPSCKTDANLCPPDPKPRLVIRAQPKKKAVKRGKWVEIKLSVRNLGKAAARDVRACVKAPKGKVRVKRCVRVGNVDARSTKTVKFRVKAKRKRGKAVLRFSAKSTHTGRLTGRAVVWIE